VIHGFTGSPFSVRGIASALVDAGVDVEVPRLPGHGTNVDDMVPTRWHDWSGEVAGSIDQLHRRVDHLVIVGQSMGATLGLAAAFDLPRASGIACINPLTRPRSAEEIAMIDDLLDDDFTVAPGSGSDIADPDSYDMSYDGTPLAAIKSLLVEGVVGITDRFGELTMPLRLFTSRNDHVVDPADSEHLANTWGGRVEHTWLERSFHVATRDFDRGVVERGVVEFVRKVAR
jgi:carboxylesterase